MHTQMFKRFALLLSLTVLLLTIVTAGSGLGVRAAAQPPSGDDHCALVGGTIMTNFGAVDQNTTLGTATGDLRGGISATLLGAPQPGPGNTLIFHVQHHWVTEAGDTINSDPATAVTVPLSKTLFAIVTYPVHITGGTGKFAGATGDLTAIGEVDLVKGTVFRYTGEICYEDQNKR
jgi:hypothetical protein